MILDAYGKPWRSAQDGWVRLHLPPKKAGRRHGQQRSAKQQWYFDRSKERYARTPDAEIVREWESQPMPGEIGRFESIRFVVSELRA